MKINAAIKIQDWKEGTTMADCDIEPMHAAALVQTFADEIVRFYETQVKKPVVIVLNVEMFARAHLIDQKPIDVEDNG